MQRIESNGALLALIWRDDDWRDGLTFPTPDELFVQVGLWQYPAGKKLRPHKHKFNQRTVTRTQEGTYVKRGRMQVTIYGEDGIKVADFILAAGDFAVMAGGGHGYEILEDGTQILEFKNGPFIDVATDKEDLLPRP